MTSEQTLFYGARRTRFVVSANSDVEKMQTAIGHILLYSGIAAQLFIAWDAFRCRIFHGVLSLLFWPYALYYALMHFDHRFKWLSVSLLLFGQAIGMVIIATS